MNSRRHQIEEKASVLFMERGYAATSMRDLATALNIEAASLYSHIKAKEEILQDICFRLAEEFFISINEVLQQEETPLVKLKMAITGHVKVVLKDISSSAVFINEWKHLSETNLKKFLQLRMEYEKKFILLIKEGVKGGAIKNIDEKFLAQYILSSINGSNSWYNPLGKMTSEEFGNQLADLLIQGIRK